MNRLTPPRIIVFSFLSAILIGAILLCLPVSTKTQGGISFIDALFTSTSATCVTGLIVKDTGAFFTPFGQGVIMCLFQLGGLGIMTLSILCAILLGRRISISNNVIMQSTITGSSFKGLSVLIRNIILTVLSIEIVGASLLFLRWHILSPSNLWSNVYSSAFHAISAFCNAGFSLYNMSFMNYSSDIYINIIITGLIIVGGFGFIVLLSLPKLKLWGRNRKYAWAKIDIQTKIVLITSLSLIIIGTITLFLLEYNHSIKDLSLKDKILGSYFQSVSSRTAGFNTLAIGKLTQASLFFLVILMFIGASPGSTGSGIKTTTFAILIATIIAMFKNKDQVTIFKRTVSREVVRKVILIFLFSLSWLIIMSFLLVLSENANSNGSFMKIIFEVTSALSNVGLSTGITSSLTWMGKLLITITMLVGRIGPLTLAWAVTLHETKLPFKYPEEKVMVG